MTPTVQEFVTEVWTSGTRTTASGSPGTPVSKADLYAEAVWENAIRILTSGLTPDIAGMSDYLRDKLIDHLFRNTAYTKPTVLGIALCTSAPRNENNGATIPELVGDNGYARQALNPLNTNWIGTHYSTTGNSSGVEATTFNTVDVQFPVATDDWGTITHVAVLDSVTHGGGNMLFWGKLSRPRTISTGDRFVLRAEELRFGLVR